MKYIDELEFAIKAKKNIRKTKVIEIIDKMLMDEDNSAYRYIMKKGTSIFRARIVENFEDAKKQGINIFDNSKTTGFCEAYSKEPPIGNTPGGRNNIKGVSYLYAAESIETACAEVKAIPQDIISIAEFVINKPLTLLNFSIDSSTINLDSKENSVIRIIAEQYRSPVKIEKGYIVSQVISDYVNKAGLDGVIYNSYFTNGNNITLFRTHPSMISFIKSRLLLYKGAAHMFWDFNNKDIIVADRFNQMEYNCEEAHRILERINSKLNPPKVYIPNCFDLD